MSLLSSPFRLWKFSYITLSYTDLWCENKNEKEITICWLGWQLKVKCCKTSFIVWCRKRVLYRMSTHTAFQVMQKNFHGTSIGVLVLRRLIMYVEIYEVGYRIHFLANFCNFFHHHFRKCKWTSSFCENQSDSTVTKISEGITEICST